MSFSRSKDYLSNIKLNCNFNQGPMIDCKNILNQVTSFLQQSQVNKGTELSRLNSIFVTRQKFEGEIQKKLPEQFNQLKMSLTQENCKLKEEDMNYVLLIDYDDYKRYHKDSKEEQKFKEIINDAKYGLIKNFQFKHLTPSQIKGIKKHAEKKLKQPEPPKQILQPKPLDNLYNDIGLNNQNNFINQNLNYPDLTKKNDNYANKDNNYINDDFNLLGDDTNTNNTFQSSDRKQIGYSLINYVDDNKKNAQQNNQPVNYNQPYYNQTIYNYNQPTNYNKPTNYNQPNNNQYYSQPKNQSLPTQNQPYQGNQINQNNQGKYTPQTQMYLQQQATQQSQPVFLNITINLNYQGKDYPKVFNHLDKPEALYTIIYNTFNLIEYKIYGEDRQEIQSPRDDMNLIQWIGSNKRLYIIEQKYS